MVPLARAQIAENNGDVEGTRSNLETALAGFRDIGDRWALGIALMSWARCARSRAIWPTHAARSRSPARCWPSSTRATTR